MMNSVDIMIKKNERMIEARFQLKKPQIVLAFETGIHYSTISRIECGYLRPTKEQKVKLAEALEVKVDWLFPDNKNDKSKFKA